MRRLLQSQSIATGLAMFSMFFGAGNLAFSLVVGRLACNKNIFAIAGFLVSAVGIPFLGLIAIILYNGDYKAFFYRIGKIPGFLLMIAILGLLGPLGGIPRCIILSYEALATYMPQLSLCVCSIIAAGVIFLCTVQEKQIITILGRFLSPLLLFCLAAIIIKGFLSAQGAPSCPLDGIQLVCYGFVEGYKTLDLCAALFFSAAVLSMVQQTLDPQDARDTKKIASIVFKSASIGAALLALVYIGMSFVTASYSTMLTSIPDQQLFIVIARHILGDTLSILLCCAVILACLTTAIALTAISAEFIEHELSHSRITYKQALVLTLLVTIPISTLQFSGIMQVLVPVLKVIYPALITLVVVNSLYKLCGFTWVKMPFYTVLVLSFLYHYGHMLV